MAYREANKFGSGSGTITTLGTKTFDGAADVDPITDRITIAAHGYNTGDYVRLTGGTAPAGLVQNNAYFVIVFDVNTILLAKTHALAFIGNAIDITADGAGTITLTEMEAVAFPRQATKIHIGVSGTLMNVKYTIDPYADNQLWFAWSAGPVSAITDATIDGRPLIAIEGSNGNYSYAFR